MKLKLPLRLLAALVTSFAGVTVGTVTITALAGIAVTVSLSPALGADITFDGTQITVPSGGSVTYDAGNVTASTTLQFSGAGTATITNLNGDAADAVLRVIMDFEWTGNVQRCDYHVFQHDRRYPE